MSQPGNGSPHRGNIQMHPIGADCLFFTQDPSDPPLAEELTTALVTVMQNWMRRTAVRVRATMPITVSGNTIAGFVWFDPVNPVSIP